MKTYERNLADQDVIVHSLKILGSAEGGAFTEIRRSVEAVKKTMSAQLKQQEEYWDKLSSDGVISSVEKQSLKREMENIRQSYSAVTAQAASFGYTNPILQDYVNTYNALREYIYDTLKLFDDMERDSVIDSRDTFNAMFSNYFFLENFIILAITQGVLDTLQFRVLSSLSEPGNEGDTGLYHGGLYQYTNGHWKSVSTGAYKGARTSCPAEEEDSFFIVSETFTITDNLLVNGTELLVNGTELGITHIFYKGFIYYCQEGVWYIEEDKTNWRYAAAFADVLNITGELPQIFQDGLDNLQTQVDAVYTSLAAEISARENSYTILEGNIVQINGDIENIVDSLETKVDHLPEYLGASAVIPQNPLEGDFFLYIGATTTTPVEWLFCNIYRWNSGEWQYLSSNDSQYKSYYMMALEDILKNNETQTGYFDSVFAESFFTNNAAINSLATSTIYLRQGGYIQSDNVTYEQEVRGLKIDSAGNIDANGNVHIGSNDPDEFGGKVAIGVPLNGNTDFTEYDVVIGGNTKISGKLDGATGTFAGLLQCGVLKIENRNIIETLFDFPVQEGKDRVIAICEYFFDLGFGAVDKNVSEVLNYNEVQLKYGNTIITTVAVTLLDGRNMRTFELFLDGEKVMEYFISYMTGDEILISQSEEIVCTWVNGYTVMKLDGIPTSRPTETGVVYRDGNTVKIS